MGTGISVEELAAPLVLMDPDNEYPGHPSVYFPLFSGLRP